MRVRDWISIAVLASIVIGIISFFQWGNYDFISHSERKRLEVYETYSKQLEEQVAIRGEEIKDLDAELDSTKRSNATLKELYEEQVSADQKIEDSLKPLLNDPFFDKVDYWKNRAQRAEHRITLLERSHSGLEALVTQQEDALKLVNEQLLDKNKIIDAKQYQIDIYQEAFERKDGKGLKALTVGAVIGLVIGLALGN